MNTIQKITKRSMKIETVSDEKEQNTKATTDKKKQARQSEKERRPHERIATKKKTRK